MRFAERLEDIFQTDNAIPLRRSGVLLKCILLAQLVSGLMGPATSASSRANERAGTLTRGAQIDEEKSTGSSVKSRCNESKWYTRVLVLHSFSPCHYLFSSRPRGFRVVRPFYAARPPSREKRNVTLHVHDSAYEPTFPKYIQIFVSKWQFTTFFVRAFEG